MIDKPHLKRLDAAAILLKIVVGDYTIHPAPSTWDAVYAGYVVFAICQDDMRIGTLNVLNDCDELDRIQEIDVEPHILAEYPDGAYGHCDNWDIEDEAMQNPLENLDEQTIRLLEDKCREALPMENT